MKDVTEIMKVIRKHVRSDMTERDRHNAVRACMSWLAELNVKNEITFAGYCNMTKYLVDWATTQEE